ncbi:hypothetical protein COU78_00610 [Candidatus Peregrinibacteria bacterium CG10_big_fil_rev_8_21_14_0_10_49_24]|nr:MAG: hypothetical protein COV83_04730 [Candidatus Peregrinibacteria bacterium CG11_big_fil_rev_8_21_14_0_20_49_14]PIR51567.1 MAG: hypothetical protein COU78_00610 [Candidatus Peregrinibacteria bacterium CG10_big_fil_rev_8_21_14_0_10_49_24]PJA67951.1 MAG: hypothetical protein CO157_01345 [Candidatus Peregrinibacteria bacterium CG_4_9_14_3_um_filter_49_12]
MIKKKKMKSSGRICNRCGAENGGDAVKCESCNSAKFAPEWVVAKRPINRQVSVEITKPDPKYGKAENRITLTKWWPGGRANFHIPNAAQWGKIEALIENDLGPILGWKKRQEIISEIRKQKQDAAAVSRGLKELVGQYPDTLRQIVSSIDAKKMTQEEMGRLMEVMGELSDALTNMNAGFREAFLAVVKKLPKQGQRALEDLEKLLENWSLHQITTVAQQVQSRLETIELFKKQIQDPRTFEIRGDNSIHRILERAMWMIDERYWLLHSNETIRTFIGEELSKKDKKKYGKKRPDFVCGTIDEKLVIVELKRPSHMLEIEDMNQLETYMTLAEQYQNFRSYEGYLVGNKKSDDLMRRMKHRSSAFKIRTYSDLLTDTEHRYSAFLKTLKK